MVVRPPRLSPSELKKFRLKRCPVARDIAGVADADSTRPGQPLRVEYVPIESLQLDPRNPRLHSDRQTKALSRCIKTFGFNVPVLIDRHGRLLAGHGRVLAARLLGMELIPIIRIESLTEEQARAFQIADNKLAESTWDDRILGEILTELAALDLDFSLEDIGFSMAEIDLRIEGLSSPNAARPDRADILPEHSDKAPISSSGTVWLLGRNRLLCGNALEPASYSVLMQGKRAHLVFTHGFKRRIFQEYAASARQIAISSDRPAQS